MFEIPSQSFYPVIVVGGGTCGLAVTARLCEAFPGSLYTEDEHQRFHWLKQRGHKVNLIKGSSNYKPQAFSPKDILVLDAVADKFTGQWDNQFAACQIPYLRLPMFFHPDPVDVDSLVCFAHRTGKEDQLKEIKNVVGKEISKHKQKKLAKKNARRGSRSTTDHLSHDTPGIIDINMRDWKDYYRPSTPLFKEFCQDLVDRYKLEDNVIHDEVESIEYLHILVVGTDESGEGFVVTTKSGRIFGCKACVVASGHRGDINYPLDISEINDMGAEEAAEPELILSHEASSTTGGPDTSDLNLPESIELAELQSMAHPASSCLTEVLVSDVPFDTAAKSSLTSCSSTTQDIDLHIGCKSLEQTCGIVEATPTQQVEVCAGTPPVKRAIGSEVALDRTSLEDLDDISINSLAHGMSTGDASSGSISSKTGLSDLRGCCHTSHLFSNTIKYLGTEFSNKPFKKGNSVVIVGGGLTSAQLAHLAVTQNVTRVYLLMRGGIKIKHFDFHLDWVTKYRNVKKSAFYIRETDEERFQMIQDAREGGSVNPEYYKLITKHAKEGRLNLLKYTTITGQKWDPISLTWKLELTNSETTQVEYLEDIDYIYFATGIQANIESLDFMLPIRKEFPIESVHGFPCLTDNLQWKADLPLFMLGKNASIRMGPALANLDGARLGAERIGWYLQDVLSRGGFDWSNHCECCYEDSALEEDSMQELNVSDVESVDSEENSYERSYKIATNQLNPFLLLVEA